MNRAPAVLLSAIAMVLAGVVLVEYLDQPSEIAALNRPSAAAAVPPAGAVAPGVDLTGSWADTALARPLFNRSRRPPPGAVTAQAAGPGIPRLTAVLITADGRSAIFAGSQGGKPIVAREGSLIGNHLVQSIADGQVTVLGPDGAHVLHPSFAGTAPGGSIPVSAPAGPSVLDQLLAHPLTFGVPGLMAPAAPPASPPQQGVPAGRPGG